MLYMTYIAIAMAYVLYYFSECVEAIQQCNNLCKCINGELSQHLNQMSYLFICTSYIFIYFVSTNQYYTIDIVIVYSSV